MRFSPLRVLALSAAFSLSLSYFVAGSEATAAEATVSVTLADIDSATDRIAIAGPASSNYSVIAIDVLGIPTKIASGQLSADGMARLVTADSVTSSSDTLSICVFVDGPSGAFFTVIAIDPLFLWQ